MIKEEIKCVQEFAGYLRCAKSAKSYPLLPRFKPCASSEVEYLLGENGTFWHRYQIQVVTPIEKIFVLVVDIEEKGRVEVSTRGKITCQSPRVVAPKQVANFLTLIGLKLTEHDQKLVAV